MSRRDPTVSLRHMLDHAREAADMIRGKTRPDLDTDRKLNLAIVRLVDIIGEAASRIPKEEQRCFPDISWPGIISMRNRLIHGYDIVDFDVLWTILTTDLPPLITSLEKTLPPENSVGGTSGLEVVP